MKKVLIHTLFYQNYNYGGMLQAYALYRELTNMGFECEELNYTQNIDNKLKKLISRSFRIFEIAMHPKYYMECKRKGAKEVEQREAYISRMGKDVLKNAFVGFINTEFKSTPVYSPDTIRKLQKQYDYYVVGGDQVWNPEWADANFFGAAVKDGKKIGFSCSAGKSKFTEYDKKKILTYINNIDSVSVREKNFSDMLSEAGVENSLIADPVFLMSPEEWSKFANDKYELPQRYVFTYLLGEDRHRRQIIKKFAEDKGYLIVSIPHVFRRYNQADENYADVEINDAGPREFISLIKNADFVLTDSFHGSAFSLIFEKQFLNFSRFRVTDTRSLNARLKNIVREYGVEERFVSIENLNKINIEEMDKINYDRCRIITEKKRTNAKKYLQTELCVEELRQ